MPRLLSPTRLGREAFLPCVTGVAHFYRCAAGLGVHRILGTCCRGRAHDCHVRASTQGGDRPAVVCAYAVGEDIPVGDLTECVTVRAVSSAFAQLHDAGAAMVSEPGIDELLMRS
jgi:hypothetical protein